jgi:hypothetical protein
MRATPTTINVVITIDEGVDQKEVERIIKEATRGAVESLRPFL